MKKQGNEIHFDDPGEVSAILKMTETYLKEHPEDLNNKDLALFYNLIDYMDMVWTDQLGKGLPSVFLAE